MKEEMKFGLAGLALFWASMTIISLCLSGSARAEDKKVTVIAHRGASGYAPENTMASFKKALELGADMIELDVHRTMDGELVVMHDAETKRTAGDENLIRLMTLNQIKKLDAGSWFGEEFKGEQVPTLLEVLEWAKGKIKVNIEIKSAECEEKVVKMIEKLEMADDIIVSSFEHEFLKKIKEINPKIRTGALVKDVESEKDLDAIIENCKPDALHPRYLLANKNIIGASHKRGLEVNVYTVNDPITMNRLIKAGADGIITNYPDMLVELLEGKKNP